MTHARPRPTLTVRAPSSRREIHAFAPILQYSLFFPPLTEANWLEREGVGNFRLALRGSEVVGGLSVQRMGQWFGGRSVPAGAVRCVAVAPELRSQGIARELLRHHLEEMRAEGVPLSVLYPSSQSFYRRSGYERGGVRIQWRVPTSALTSAMPRGVTLRTLARSDAPAMQRLWDRRARASNGILDRGEWLWRRVHEPLGIKDLVSRAIVEGGELTGWITCRAERIPSMIAAGLVRVTELHAATEAAHLAALAFLAGHRSVVQDAILFVAPNDPLWHLLPNQDQRAEQVIHWLLRLVDVPRALEARGYPMLVAAEAHLAVRDAVCPWNQGRFVLKVEGGRARVQSGGRGTVRTDVRGLASIYTSLATPAAMAAAGLVSGPEPELARLGEIFAGPAPWMPDMF